VLAALRDGRWEAGGADAGWCEEWLRARTGADAVRMMPSCTDALECAMLLCGVGPGDEVIVPSWTFVSTANAIVLRGATPVWVDVEPGTLNLDPEAAAAAVTSRTRAVVAVHYAGIATDLDALGALAQRHDLTLVEDAAHALLARWRGRALGSIGRLGCLSFDPQKNVSAGEGGALLVNDPDLVEAAVVAADRGTNRAQHLRGEAARYEWVASGSAWGLAGLAAALLRAGLELAEEATQRRLAVWARYQEAFAPLMAAGRLQTPRIPAAAEQNGHIFWLMLPTRGARDALIAHLSRHGIDARFHFVPLHTTAAGLRFGRSAGTLPVTTAAGEGLVRLPRWSGMDEEDVDAVVRAVEAWAGSEKPTRSERIAQLP
jgi:dTDP-4-amino-4,6-dideoxygalactose transaminase